MVDVNDNPPEFERTTYSLSVSEATPVGTGVGRVYATSHDVGANADISYSIVDSVTSDFDVNSESGNYGFCVTLTRPLQDGIEKNISSSFSRGGTLLFPLYSVHCQHCFHGLQLGLGLQCCTQFCSSSFLLFFCCSFYHIVSHGSYAAGVYVK